MLYVNTETVSVKGCCAVDKLMQSIGIINRRIIYFMLLINWRIYGKAKRGLISSTKDNIQLTKEVRILITHL